MLLKVWILYCLTTIEINVFFRQYLYGHVVHRMYFSLQDDGVEQSIDTGIALLIRMLCYQKRDAALTNTGLVLGHHIITHDLDIPAITLLEEIAYDMCF